MQRHVDHQDQSALFPHPGDQHKLAATLAYPVENAGLAVQVAIGRRAIGLAAVKHPVETGRDHGSANAFAQHDRAGSIPGPFVALVAACISTGSASATSNNGRATVACRADLAKVGAGTRNSDAMAAHLIIFQYLITERITLPACSRSKARLMSSSGITSLIISSILISPFI